MWSVERHVSVSLRSNVLRAMSDAFLASVIRSHGPKLIRYFRAQLAEPTDAGDLVQEVYVRLLKLKRPERIRCVQAYVYRVASSVMREYWLKNRARCAHVSLEELGEPALPCAVAERLEHADRLEALLKPLPPKKRAVLIWAHRDGYTYEEISARLAVPKNRVKKYLRKALAQVRKELAAEG